MNTTFLEDISPDFIKFLLVGIFSLLIGLEQRRHNIKAETETLFGTDRTFTLIGILGFILYIISRDNLLPFLAGGIVIGALMLVYYNQKMKLHQKFGMTSLVTALITYSLAPLIYTQPLWLFLMIVVVILIVSEIKETLLKFSEKVDNSEYLTLAKFIILAGIILPLLPDTPISAAISVSPFKFWLAIVVVSGISYFSYLLRKFVFPDTGILLTGILGGLYSSTSTTVILAKKSKEGGQGNKIVAAMFLAISMMYLRIFLLALFFNPVVAIKLLPYFIILVLISTAVALYFIFVRKSSTDKGSEAPIKFHDNPLEFKTAFVFGGLFIAFALITNYVVTNFGAHGAQSLAFVVGVTDIDPFIINLFSGKLNIDTSVITLAVLNAITSNNVLKMCYALFLSDKSLRKDILIGFGTLIAAGIVAVII